MNGISYYDVLIAEQHGLQTENLLKKIMALVQKSLLFVGKNRRLSFYRRQIIKGL